MASKREIPSEKTESTLIGSGTGVASPVKTPSSIKATSPKEMSRGISELPIIPLGNLEL